MSYDVKGYISENTGKYDRMLLEKANLDLVPKLKESGEVLKGHFNDSKSKASSYIARNTRGTQCSVFTAPCIASKNDYGIVFSGDDEKLFVRLSFFDGFFDIDITKEKITITAVYDKIFKENIFVDKDGKLKYQRTNETAFSMNNSIAGIMEALGYALDLGLIINNSKCIDNAEEVYKFVEPILKVAIEEIFVKAMEDKKRETK